MHMKCTPSVMFVVGNYQELCTFSNLVSSIKHLIFKMRDREG
jgi:Tfp pilus assembly protein PilO